MSTITISELTPILGVEVSGLDIDQLLNDDSVPQFIWSALREHGVLLFRGLGFTPQTQLKFSERLGMVDAGSSEEYGERGVQRVSLDPKRNGGIETLKGTFNWHMDGCTLPDGRYPSPATILTCDVKSEVGGQTSFASTRAFYATLDQKEKERLLNLRVIHSILGSRRRVFSNYTSEQEATWDAMGRREHPLVWKHQEGLPSLIIGGTSENIVGWNLEEGVQFLDELAERAAAPDRIYTHEWDVGDTVIWDNPGMLHSVAPYPEDSGREMIRCTLVGVEPTESV